MHNGALFPSDFFFVYLNFSMHQNPGKPSTYYSKFSVKLMLFESSVTQSKSYYVMELKKNKKKKKRITNFSKQNRKK